MKKENKSTRQYYKSEASKNASSKAIVMKLLTDAEKRKQKERSFYLKTGD